MATFKAFLELVETHIPNYVTFSDQSPQIKLIIIWGLFIIFIIIGCNGEVVVQFHLETQMPLELSQEVCKPPKSNMLS